MNDSPFTLLTKPTFDSTAARANSFFNNADFRNDSWRYNHTDDHTWRNNKSSVDSEQQDQTVVYHATWARPGERYPEYNVAVEPISDGSPLKKSKLADPASNHYQNVGQQRQSTQQPEKIIYIAKKPIPAVFDEPINQQKWNLIRVKRDNIRKE